MAKEEREIWEAIKKWFGARIPLDAKEIINFITLTGLVYGPLDRRLGIKEGLQKALKKPVPEHVNWTFCFGGITLTLFVIQAVTGVLLALYYKPSPDAAYASVQNIMVNVRFGWLIRQVHAWGANLMILMVFMHMLRVFFYGAYKPPRELNWMVGVVALFTTMTFGFTGYLLPWDQLAYWATAVGTGILGSVPIVGKQLLFIARGGEDITGETLSRFYTAHVVILPAVTSALMGIHLLMVRRQGISGPL